MTSIASTDASSVASSSVITSIDDALKEKIAEMLTAASVNIAGPDNYDGEKWKEALYKNFIRVETSKSKKSSFNLFRSMMKFQTGADSSFDDVVAEIWEYDKRAKWDAQMAGGRMLLKTPVLVKGIQKDNDLVEVNVSRYNTIAALGGFVKPRVFTDLIVTINPEEKKGKEKATEREIMSTSIAWDIKKNKATGESIGLTDSAVAFIGEEKGMVRATNLLGGCLRIRMKSVTEKEGEQRKIFHVNMVGLTDLGGWLPSSVINTQSATAFHDIFKSFCDKIGGKLLDLDEE
eukprot:g997.t1